MTYVLGQPLVDGMPFFPQNFSKQDMGVAEAVLNFLSNFAKSGDPNGRGTHKDVPDYGTMREKNRYRDITWEPYEIGTQFYLSISKYLYFRIFVEFCLLLTLSTTGIRSSSSILHKIGVTLQ